MEEVEEEVMVEGEEEVMVEGERRRKLGGVGNVERAGAIVTIVLRGILGVAPHLPAPAATGGG